VNLTSEENLWVVLAMTLDAVDKTTMLDPAFRDRFATQGEFRFNIPPLEAEEARDLVEQRLKAARPKGKTVPHSVFPFDDSFPEGLNPAIFSSPRKLVKVCFFALSEASQVPLSVDYLRSIAEKAYPEKEL
jgi:hypothetical protein